MGGGKVGFYLTKTLLKAKHRVTVIDSDPIMCRKIANELGVEAIQADGTDIEALEHAGTKEADVFIAVTGKDEDNLIACQLAKKKFGIHRTISNVNNPKNIEVFQKLGVDQTTSSTSVIAQVIEQEVNPDGMKMLMKLKNSNVAMHEILITATSPVFEKQLKNLRIPKKCIIVSIIRETKALIPNGESTILNGDLLIMMAREEDYATLKKYFLG